MQNEITVKQRVRELKAVQDRIKGLQEQEKGIKHAILNDMQKSDLKSLLYEYENENLKISTSRVERIKYTFDMEQLKAICMKKGGRKLYNSCVNKTYKVREDVMKKVLKKYPKLKKPITKFIYIEAAANEDKIIEAVERGELSYLDVKAFSTEEKTSEYVTIRTSNLTE